MNKCPKCGAPLGEGATKCACGWEAKNPNSPELNENPQTPEEYTKNLGILVQRSEAETKDFKETVEKVSKENEDLKKEITEVKGEIERVRVNTPPIIDPVTNKVIPVEPLSRFMGLSNEQCKNIYEWWKNGPVYGVKQKMNKWLTPADHKAHQDYIQKMQPYLNMKAQTSEAYKDQTTNGVREKAVVTGSMGLEQTGYGLEWAPELVSSTIIALATYDSIILKEGYRVPVSTHKVGYPVADYTELGVKWPATELEGTPEVPDRLASSIFHLQAKWGYVNSLLGKQFIRNCDTYGIAVVDSLLTFMKSALAVKVDTDAWTGETATEVCDGLEIDSTITDVDLTAGDDTFAEILYTDMINFKYELPQRYRKGAKIYGSPKFLSTMRVMPDANGNLINPMFHMPNPLGLDGVPLVEVDVANETEADTKPVCVYGNLKNYFAYGFLQDMTFDSTDQVYWREGGILFRLEFWADMGVTLGTAMRRLLFNTA